MIKVERVMFSGDIDEGVVNPLDLRGAVWQMYQDLRDGIIKKCTFVDLALCEEENVEFGNLFDEAERGVVFGVTLPRGELSGGCE